MRILGLGEMPVPGDLFRVMGTDREARVLVGERKLAQKVTEAQPNVALSLDQVFAMFDILKQRQRQLAGTLSGGEQQMLAIGRALMSGPRLLMLDEPSLGLAPLVVREIFKTIDALRKTGVTTLLVEQNARAALETADYGYVLEMGEVALHGPAQDLAKDARVIDTYLGAARKPVAATESHA